jgi:uncharacterized membrane protein YbhN (UPF0104 family)
MLNATRNALRFVSAKIGWSSVGVVISVLIIVFAGITLVRLLRDVEPNKILLALQATNWWMVLTAAAFAVAGYLTYSLYDFFALRTIERPDIPYRAALFGSFMAYAIGHNLGATVFTAAAVRYRVYSRWGLTLIDIAKIAFVTGLTFWLGNAVMLGIGIGYIPQAASRITELPQWFARATAFAGLAAIIVYLLWLLPRPRAIGRSNWQITLPNARLTLAQIGIGVLDLSWTALTLWALLPATPVDAVTIVVTFVAAILLGFLSHAPGSLGVLEAAMLLGLPEIEKETLLASLLVFRLLYFIMPLFLALIALALLEWNRMRPSAEPDGSAISPRRATPTASSGPSEDARVDGNGRRRMADPRERDRARAREELS